MKDQINVVVAPGSTTIEPSGATDDIRYVLNREPPAADATPGNPKAAVVGADHDVAGKAEAADSGSQPAGAGGLADSVIDNVDQQLPDQTDSTIRGGKVGQESKRGAY